MKQGFSLLEILIALAIVAILATLIYPSYTHYLLKVRRKHAEIMLLNIAARIEVYNSTNNKHNSITLSKLKINPKEETHYRFSIQSSNLHQYQVSATPIGSQTKDHCGKLTVNETGQRTPQQDCW